MKIKFKSNHLKKGAAASVVVILTTAIVLGGVAIDARSKSRQGRVDVYTQPLTTQNPADPVNPADPANPDNPAEPMAQTAPEPAQVLQLTEYMPSNHTVDFGGGATPDWAELYNAGDSPVDLGGCTLTDHPDEPEKWTFPEGTAIGAHEYLVVLLDGKPELSGTDGYLHAAFRLGEKDTALQLRRGSELLLDMPLVYTAQSISIGTEKGETVFYRTPTPGAPNGQAEESAASAAMNLTPTILFNEVSAFSTHEMETGHETEDFDWVELTNVTGAAIDLSGYVLCDEVLGKKPENEYHLGNTALAPGEFLLIYAAGAEPRPGTVEAEEAPERTADSLYAPFKISGGGDTLYLYDPQGQLVDFFEMPHTMGGDTAGHNAAGETQLYDTPTPGEANAPAAQGYTAMPALSNPGGFVQKGEVISAEIPAGVTLHFTDDGAKPTPDSPVFTGYTVEEDCVLRFLAVQEGCLSSAVWGATYFTDRHDIPVVCVSSDAEGLYSEENGIFAMGTNASSAYPYRGANFWQDWEREISFEYYTPEGERAVACSAGARIHGQYSRADDQKSLAVYFRGKYGTDSVKYPFFGEEGADRYASILLRASGQDQTEARIRDALAAKTAMSCTDLACMDWRPIALYINGEYAGLYDLREKISARYFEEHEGIAQGNLDLVKDHGNVLHGSNDDFRAVEDYIASHDMSQQEHYDYVCQKIDMANYMDYLIMEVFFANQDGGTNTKHYRNAQDGKWRWVLYDVDLALLDGTDSVGDANSMQRIFDPDGEGADEFSIVTLQRGLLKNQTFRQQFIARYNELLDTALSPESMTERLNQMTAQQQKEMQLHSDAGFVPSYSYWQSCVDDLRDTLQVRRDVCRAELESYFN